MGSATFTFQSKVNDKEELEHLESLRKLDRSFINSILSYAVYTKNASWFESWAELKALNPQSKMLPHQVLEQDIFQKESRAHDRVFAVMVSQFFSPAELNLKATDTHQSNNYSYDFDSQYKNGIYKALDNLSGACAMKTKNDDDTYTLHVSFRGTDDQAQSMSRYLTKAYPDMAAYYESFKPFEKSCVDYAKDKHNKISKIEVSGHSLGGAMVQHFFLSPEVKSLQIPLEGHTFGSPHALSSAWYDFVPALRHSLKYKTMKNLIVTSGNFMTRSMTKNSYDNRINQYQHSGDLIPKIAGLVMNKTGNVISLPDTASNTPLEDHLLTNANKSYYASMYKKMEKSPTVLSNIKYMIYTACESFIKPVRVVKRAFNWVYHDMARYCINLENQMSAMRKDFQVKQKERKIYLESYDLKPITPYMERYSAICRSMKINTKASARLEGQEVQFNEYVEPNQKFMQVGINLVNMLKTNIEKKDTSKYPPYTLKPF